MDNIFEELNKIYENENIPTLLDMVKCSTIVIVPDVREFTHLDTERIAASFNYDNEIDFEEDYISESTDILKNPLARKTIEKFIVSKDEVKNVINKIATSNINLITNEYTDNGIKNNLFMQKHDLPEEDIEYLIKQLKVGDYSYSAKSKNINHIGDILTFFITNKNFKLLDGSMLNNLKVYVKIDSSKLGIITAVSFHDATGSIKHPYTNEDNEV